MGMGDIVRSLDLDKMTNAGALADRYLFQHKGGTFGVGVMDGTKHRDEPRSLSLTAYLLATTVRRRSL